VTTIDPPPRSPSWDWLLVVVYWLSFADSECISSVSPLSSSMPCPNTYRRQ